MGGTVIVIVGPGIVSANLSRSEASNTTFQVPAGSVVVRVYRTPFFQLSAPDAALSALRRVPMTMRT